MVVHAAAIITKSGKALVSRHYVEMTRMKIESLYSSFPKLIATPTSIGGAEQSGSVGGTKQHTFVDVDNVRYLYLPMESLYLLLITNKGSNIVEDLETLRLLAKVIPEQLEYGAPTTEDNIVAKAFELIFAFDEAISPHGYRDELNLSTIRTNLEMESHEEKLHNMIKASKMAEAKEAARRKANEIRDRARAEEKMAREMGLGSSGSGRYGSASSTGAGYNQDYPVSGPRDQSPEPVAKATPTPAPVVPPSSGQGMRLGALRKPGDINFASGALAGLMAEEGLPAADLNVPSEASVGGAAAAITAAKAAAEAATAEQVTVTIEEKVQVRLGRDGGVMSMDVRGSLTALVNDKSAERMRIILSHGQDKVFNYQIHPHVNKALFSETPSIITLKDTSRALPIGNSVGLLRWRYQNKDDDSSQVPLLITCWPEEGANGMVNVNLEYTLQNPNLTLNEVLIFVPIVGDQTPKVTLCDGVYQHNPRANVLIWRLESVSRENDTGSMEFSIRGADVDSFFPIRVQYSSNDTLCPVEVQSVVPLDSDKPFRFGIQKACTADEYTVE